MRNLTRKLLLSTALVLCMSCTAYADETVELSDGPVKEALASSAEELAQMHDGSQIPVYITKSDSAAPDAEEVEILDSITGTSHKDTSSAAESTVIEVSPVLGNGSSQTTVSEIGPGVSGTQQNSVVTTAKRMDVINYAKQFLGNPYVYGGTSLTDGADCSGFTQAVFAHFGITTGRSSRDQYAKAEKITQAELQPGDLVFYASGDYINHVAIYCGNQIIIHAANEETGIATSNAYYREPYGYGRFIQD